MSWERFEQPATGKTEIWFRFLGGHAGDWERPNGQRLKCLGEAKKLGWRRIGPCQPPGMVDEGEPIELPSISLPNPDKSGRRPRHRQRPARLTPSSFAVQ